MKKLNMTLVSASSANHFLSQLKWLESVFKHNDPRRVVVWDLGWKPEQLKRLSEEWGDRVVLRTFDYSQYPSWFDIKKAKGEYAWKPCLIKETFDEFHDVPSLWMDAGCLVDDHLSEVLTQINTHGMFCSRTTGTLKEYTDKRTLDFMKIPSRMRSRGMRAATVVGFSPAFPEAVDLLDKWAELAQVKECIAPEGSSKGRPNPHRQDQSVLTALLVHRGFDDVLPKGRPGFRIQCDEETRLKRKLKEGRK